MVKVKKEIIKKEYIQQKSKRFVKKKNKRAKESFKFPRRHGRCFYV
jgi:hypothetical protein